MPRRIHGFGSQLILLLFCFGDDALLRLPRDEHDRPVLTHSDEHLIRSIEEAADAPSAAP